MQSFAFKYEEDEDVPDCIRRFLKIKSPGFAPALKTGQYFIMSEIWSLKFYFLPKLYFLPSLNLACKTITLVSEIAIFGILDAEQPLLITYSIRPSVISGSDPRLFKLIPTKSANKRIRLLNVTFVVPGLLKYMNYVSASSYSSK